MSARVRFQGLDELRAALRNMPKELAGDADAIVDDAADAAIGEMHYPVRTGKLANGLKKVKEAVGSFGVRIVVKNTNKLALIFEHGTQARHTELGANRGSMPPGNVFIPPVIRNRRKMFDRLKQMLTEHGLVVRGDE